MPEKSDVELDPAQQTLSLLFCMFLSFTEGWQSIPLGTPWPVSLGPHIVQTPETSQSKKRSIIQEAHCMVKKHGIFSEQWFEVIFSSAAVSLKLMCKPEDYRALGRLGLFFAWVRGSCWPNFCLQPLVEWQEKKKGPFEGSWIQMAWTECQALAALEKATLVPA